MNKLQICWLDFLVTINAQKRLQRKLKTFLKANKSLRLFETKHSEVIVQTYAEFHPLTEDFLLKVFELPNAKEILLQYVKNRQLPIPVEMKLFGNPKEMAEVIQTYVRLQRLSKAAIIKLFELPNAEELITLYIDNRWGNIPKEAELKLLDLPKNEKVLQVYTQYRELHPETQLKLFSQLSPARAWEWLQTYSGILCDEAQLKMFEFSNSDVLTLQYALKHSLNEKAETKLFELNNADEIVSCYINKYSLNENNEAKLFDLPNGVELMIKYLKKHKPTEKTIEMIFNHRKASQMLPILVTTQKLCRDHEMCLFKQPNATELLAHYIENNELCEEAQHMLFDLPKKTQATLLEKYAIKHEFAKSVIQRLAVLNYFY